MTAYTIYDYKDVSGRLLYSVQRGPDKDFRRFRMVAGQRINNWDGVQQVPYRLENIGREQVRKVLFVEGEKDVDNLTKLGINATTVAGGSNAWNKLLKQQPHFCEKYFGRYAEVIILPDNDDPGRKFAEDAAQALHDVTSVKICDLPELGPGGDVSDWISNNPGCTASDLAQVIQECFYDYKPPKKDLTSSISNNFEVNIYDTATEAEKGQIENDLEQIHSGILAKLDGGSWSGNTFNAKCPTHDDKKASLSVTLKDDKILMFCHAGCGMESIAESLGVKRSELFRHRRAELKHAQSQPIPEADLSKVISKVLEEREEPEDFDDKYLPAVLRQFSQETSQLTEAAPVIIMSTCLAAMGAAAQLNLQIREPNYFVSLYPNIWTLSIAESGSFKTTALNVGAKRLLERERELLLEIKSDSEFIDAMVADNQDPEQNEEMQFYLNRREELRKKRRVLPEKSSWEAVIDRIDETGGGVWLLSEFGAWLSALDSKHNSGAGMKQALTSLYDCPDFYEDSTRHGGSKLLQNPFVSLSGVSTVEFLRGLLSRDDAGSGFLARFLLFRPPAKRKTPDALPLGKKKIQELDSYRLISEIFTQLEETTQPIQYELSPSAKRAFTEYHNQLFQRFYKLDSEKQFLFDPFIKRWSPGVLKLSMLMQFLIDSETNIISEEAVMAGISICLYAETCTKHLFKTQLGESDHQSKERKVYDFIMRQGGKTDRQKLLRSKVLNGGKMEYDDKLANLEEQGRIFIQRIEGRIPTNAQITLTAETTTPQPSSPG